MTDFHVRGIYTESLVVTMLLVGFVGKYGQKGMYVNKNGGFIKEEINVL